MAANRALAAIAEDDRATDAELVDAVLLLAQTLGRLGRLDEAADVLADAVVLADEQDPPDPARRVEVAVAVAMNSRERGDYGQAAQVLGDALAGPATELGPDSPELAGLHAAVGLLARYAGRYDDARRQYGLALTAAHGAGDRLREAMLEHNLGGLAQACGDLEAAEAHARRAVELNRALLGSDHPVVLADEAALASILDQRGDSRGAEATLRRVIAAFALRFGPDHVEVAINRTNLAAVLHRRGEYEAAIALYRQGLAGRERAQGPTHPELALVLVNMADALRAADPENRESDALLARAVRLLEPQVDPAHPVLAAARGRMADRESLIPVNRPTAGTTVSPWGTRP
jgi:tetratricopeptide (TPR) repeat protein